MKPQDKIKNKQLVREAQEKIDNKVVLATAIALVSAMVLVFLMNWMKSTVEYIEMALSAINILKWACLAGIVLFLVLYFVKKKASYLFGIPYCAVGVLFMMELLQGKITTFFIKLLAKVPFLKVELAGLGASTKQRFTGLFIVLAVYLVVSYIYYAIKRRKISK